MSNAWGEASTQYFYSLTPDVILSAVESQGYHCTGRAIALASMENRVYEIELDIDLPASSFERYKIAKFYRPGRWNAQQILEEHEFLLQAQEHDLPVVAPERFQDGSTLQCLEEQGIYYTLFPKVGGRIPDEFDEEKLRWMGRLIARLHNVGQLAQAPNRIELNPLTYGHENLDFLIKNKLLPEDYSTRFAELVLAICKLSEPVFQNVPVQRIHGDCHRGNILWGVDGPMLVDFDDMVRGPCVQDLWLLVPGRDDYSKRQLETLIEGYQQMRDFPRRSLNLIEPLRALRIVHFVTWIARRWEDPAFQTNFPEFGSARYWQEQLGTLSEQYEILASGQNPWL